MALPAQVGSHAMPPLIVAVLIGAGAYAGFRVARSVWTGLAGAMGARSDGPMDEARDRDDVVKDLGALELDAATGEYRPARRE